MVGNSAFIVISP